MFDWITKLPRRDLAQLNRLGPLALLALLLYLCWKLATLFWLLVAPIQPMQLERVNLGSQQTQIPNISAFALFQESTAKGNVTDLNMTLQGVLLSSPEHFSSAVIKVADKAERYRVGETIEGSSYVLSEVHWDRVLLRQGATVHELLFKGLEQGLNQPFVAQQSGVRSVEQAPTSIDPEPQPTSEQREEYFKKLGIQSNENGIEVSQGMPASMRHRLGVQPGDRILSLNGQRLSAGQNEMQLLDQAKKLGQAKVEIQRGDQVITIQQDLK